MFTGFTKDCELKDLLPYIHERSISGKITVNNNTSSQNECKWREYYSLYVDLARQNYCAEKVFKHVEYTTENKGSGTASSIHVIDLPDSNRPQF